MEVNIEAHKLVYYTIPVWQVAVYVVCVALCMLARKDRLGIIISYGFVVYWGYVVNWGIHRTGGISDSALAYVISGMFIALLAVLGLVRK